MAGTRTPRMRSMRFIETRAALLFISPWIIGFLIFTAWPVINSAYLSLTDYDVINDPSFIGFDNYVTLFEDPKVGLALRNTFLFTVMSVPTQLVVSSGWRCCSTAPPGPPASSARPSSCRR
ncbi:carbohydrate ABC transporter permease [Nonomuraea rubra]|uniref:carbohydrate ABC transporter permease n=1 Tax=Nonomuraea rubra TaxID=46180 RepID=UPI0036210E4B